MEENTQDSNTTSEAIRDSAPNDTVEPEKKKLLKSKWPVLIGIFVILILISAGAAYFLLNSNKQVACTTEAKLCPDGSSVGRSGPKCEFSKCPTLTPTPTVTLLDTSDWETYTGNNFSIKYPSDYSVNVAGVDSSIYISFQNSAILISITEADNSKNLTLENALGNGPGLTYVSDFLKNKTVQNLTIAGVKGVGIENIPAGQTGTTFDFTWIKGDKIYQATTGSQEGYTTLKQMLSTFKFTQ